VMSQKFPTKTDGTFQRMSRWSRHIEPS